MLPSLQPDYSHFSGQCTYSSRLLCYHSNSKQRHSYMALCTEAKFELQYVVQQDLSMGTFRWDCTSSSLGLKLQNVIVSLKLEW